MDYLKINLKIPKTLAIFSRDFKKFKQIRLSKFIF